MKFTWEVVLVEKEFAKTHTLTFEGSVEHVANLIKQYVKAQEEMGKRLISNKLVKIEP